MNDVAGSRLWGRSIFQGERAIVHHDSCLRSAIAASAQLLAVVLLMVRPVSAQAPKPMLLVQINASPTSDLEGSGGAAVELVDPAKGVVVGRIPTGRTPGSIAVSPDGRLLFTSYSPNALAVIDLESGKELRRVDVGSESWPSDPIYVGGKVYFKAGGYKALGRYDPAADRIDWFVGHGQASSSILAVSRDGDRIFVTHRQSNSVSAVEGMLAGPPKWTVTNIPVDGSGEGLDISRDDREVWVANRFGAGVSILDVASKKVTTIPVPFDGPKGEWERRAHQPGVETSLATRLIFTPDGRRVLLLNRPTAEVVVLDTATRKELKRLSIRGDNMIVTPDGARAYVSVEFPAPGSRPHVAEIDLQTLQVTRRIETGGRPTYMAFVGK